MASPQQTITGELRKWHREYNSNGKPVVIGKMFNDANEVWEDGEDAMVHYLFWVESANFYLAATALGAIKCSKDEEDKRFAPLTEFNGSDNPEKG